MNRLLLLLVFALVSLGVMAQDVIVLKNGTEIQCVIESVSPTTLTYKTTSDANAPTYTFPIALLNHITYGNGQVIRFDNEQSGASESTTASFITQETASQFSYDQQLERLHESMNEASYRKNAQRWKKAGLIGGGILLAGGIAMLPIDTDRALVIGCAAGGALIWGGTCLIISNHYNKKANNAAALFTSSIYSHEINFSDGTCLNVGIDGISTSTLFCRSLGAGVNVCYTF